MKQTQIININDIVIAAEALKQGKLVVFPTETVYGLGADALDIEAVRGIFEAKGRPADNPLIVHIAELSELKPLVDEVTVQAKQLMEAFWPGPLTLVMKKSNLVPMIITAGLETVAIRMPSHPIARELIIRAGVPVAAPSANISGRPSPTDEAHVIEDLDGRVDVILKGGATSVGLESTVVDVTGDIVKILRPGFITKEDLEEIVGEVEYDGYLLNHNEIPKAPGMKYTHYSPKAQVIIVTGNNVIELMLSVKNRLEDQGKRVGIMVSTDFLDDFQGEVCNWGDSKNLPMMASRLFACLRTLDSKKVDVIVTHAVERKKLGVAIMNRLEKAAGYYIIESEEDLR
jgi:L-threonylcarbamoyladenylate synthase